MDLDEEMGLEDADFSIDDLIRSDLEGDLIYAEASIPNREGAERRLMLLDTAIDGGDALEYDADNEIVDADEDDKSRSLPKPPLGTSSYPKCATDSDYHVLSHDRIPGADIPRVCDEGGAFVGWMLPEGTSRSISKPNSIEVLLPPSTTRYPESLYDGFELPAPLMSETEAIQTLLGEHEAPKRKGPSFLEFGLHDFTIYGGPKPDPDAMRPLHVLSIRNGHKILYFDGILTRGDRRVFVKKVAFGDLPIGGYGGSRPTVGDQVWISSEINRKTKSNVYYKLGSPSKSYRRFYVNTLWLFDLAKHFVDFVSRTVERRSRATLADFRARFHAWLQKKHGRSPIFRRWAAAYGQTDFRLAITANKDFLWKEACGVLGLAVAKRQPIWSEILLDIRSPKYRAYEALSQEHAIPYDDRLGYEPLTPAELAVRDPESINWIAPTIVTPYIYECFRHLASGILLRPVEPVGKAAVLRNVLIRQRSLELPSHIDDSPKELHTVTSTKEKANMVRNIGPGDVISTQRDDETSDTQWKRAVPVGLVGADVDRWFGLVQKVHIDNRQERSFDIIWFYQPVDTPCGMMKYPWNNELFLSTHCTCDTRSSRIKQNEVLAVHSIEWGGSSKTKAEFFCRQTYIEDERHWITWRKEHLRCEHCRSARESTPPVAPRPVTLYEPGDAVLVELGREDELVEPCEVVRVYENDEGSGSRSEERAELCGERGQRAELRRLLRRREVDPASLASPNELVFSDQMVNVEASSIVRKCVVRIFGPEETVPTPYDRKGAGNIFFITHAQKLDAEGKVVYVPVDKTVPISLRQGFDPSKPVPKLRGLDLFCGGGNFGRGLEEGGAIEVQWANDISPYAIHTYMANQKQSSRVSPFLGSIDDMQLLAIQGKFSDQVPRIGDVDFVSAGSPCQGFTPLNSNAVKRTGKQRKNQSMVAAFASFIDVYRPKYGILENVPGIVWKIMRTEDIFAQLICAIVGLGYQTRFFQLDSWSCGNTQSRSRIFLCFSAPGVPLPDCPQPSHSNPSRGIQRAAGKLANGQRMFMRTFEAAPFKYVSAEEAVGDLPDIGDAKPDSCIPFPDHRCPIACTPRLVQQFSLIPTVPWGMTFSRTWREGKGSIMTQSEREIFPSAGHRVSKMSTAWGRVRPKLLMPSITCQTHPSDWKIGRQLHWHAYRRPISIMEARRSQGFLDDELVLGEKAQQIRTIGNSVAREVSLALGLVIREAWLGSLLDQEARPGALVEDISALAGMPREVLPDALALDDDDDDDDDEEDLPSGTEILDPTAPRPATSNVVVVIPAEPRNSEAWRAALEYVDVTADGFMSVAETDDSDAMTTTTEHAGYSATESSDERTTSATSSTSGSRTLSTAVALAQDLATLKSVPLALMKLPSHVRAASPITLPSASNKRPLESTTTIERFASAVGSMLRPFKQQKVLRGDGIWEGVPSPLSHSFGPDSGEEAQIRRGDEDDASVGELPIL